ncbi:MAG: hypothetical protein AAFZ15_31860 [Bacteroidota bacterium]
MHQSKLIELLRKIPAGQVSRFREFLGSPYFNKNEDNLLFFNYLAKNLSQGKEEKLSKEWVLKELELSKPIDEKRLAYLMNTQLGLLEKFLSVEQFMEDDFGQQLMKMKRFNHLQLPRHYKTAVSKVQKMIEKSPLRNAGFFQNMQIFKKLQYEHSDQAHRNFDKQLQDAADALDAYFLVEKLYLSCQMTNLKNILNIDYHMPFADQVLEWSGQPAFLQIPAVQIYRRLLLLLHNPADNAGFVTLKNLLSQNESLFENTELKALYTLLLNHCTRRINLYNDKESLSEYFEINKILLGNGLIFERGYLQPWRYSNLVHIALRLGQTEWARQFIQQYKDKLPEAHVENMHCYNLALYHYHLGDYAEAQLELLRVDLGEDVLLNIGSRSLLIKIYYETGQSGLLFSYLEATRIYLHRNKLIDPRMKKQMQKFVLFTTKVARLEPFEKEKLQKLLKELPPATGIMHREWIRERINLKITAF